jgi:hypothetical protein
MLDLEPNPDPILILDTDFGLGSIRIRLHITDHVPFSQHFPYWHKFYRYRHLLLFVFLPSTLPLFSHSLHTWLNIVYCSKYHNIPAPPPQIPIMIIFPPPVISIYTSSNFIALVLVPFPISPFLLFHFSGFFSAK